MIALLERLFAVVSGVTRRFLEIAGPHLSVLKPFHQRYFALIRQYTDAKIFFHSDGNVVELLDDLIEIGVDVLNPVQVSAFAEPQSIKERYGDRLAFWGGIDTQATLPHGSSQDVADEVLLRIRQFGRHGGYVVASVHNIQARCAPGERDRHVRRDARPRRVRLRWLETVARQGEEVPVAFEHPLDQCALVERQLLDALLDAREPLELSV